MNILFFKHILKQLISNYFFLLHSYYNGNLQNKLSNIKLLLDTEIPASTNRQYDSLTAFPNIIVMIRIAQF